jgi:hypothetical protein
MWLLDLGLHKLVVPSTATLAERHNRAKWLLARHGQLLFAPTPNARGHTNHPPHKHGKTLSPTRPLPATCTCTPAAPTGSAGV